MSKEMLELAGRLERQAKLRCLGLDTQEILQQAAAALRASAVAEPVAWRTRNADKTLWLLWPSRPRYADDPGIVCEPLYAHPAPAEPVPASVWEALEKIGGDREYSAADIASHAQKPHKTIDESVAEDALASLPAPEAAPTRDEIIEQCAKVCNRWIKSKNVHESLAADDIAKAILALKAAPAK